MKVIKEGNLPENKEKKEKCYWCKTQFTYTKSDIQFDNRDGNYVVCPKCGKFIASDDKFFLPNF